MISGGVVRMNGLNVGFPAGNSALTTWVSGGTVTNTGDLIVNNMTSGRGSRFLQTGGLFVNEPNLVRVAWTNAGQVDIFSVTGGTNVTSGFVLGALTNVSGTVNFTNAGSIYVGSGGIISNSIQTLNIALNTGGTFGARADWATALTLNLNGLPFTFDASDLSGVAHNITILGIIRGGGSLNKIGSGTLTLSGTNIYTGTTTVTNGVLALGPNGSINTVRKSSRSARAFSTSPR